MHPSGGVVGVTNRGAHCVSLFNLDQSTGRLSFWQAVPSGGVKPRDFAFSPCGRWMLVTNQDSDSLVLYALDLETARLEDTGQRLQVRSPSVAKVV